MKTEEPNTKPDSEKHDTESQKQELALNTKQALENKNEELKETEQAANKQTEELEREKTEQVAKKKLEQEQSEIPILSATTLAAMKRNESAQFKKSKQLQKSCDLNDMAPTKQQKRQHDRGLGL